MALSFRQSEILEIARSEGRVVVEDLATRFDVTLQTIRRDLTDLADAGFLDRVHGGAVPRTGVTNLGYDERRRMNEGAKAAIAKASAQSDKLALAHRLAVQRLARGVVPELDACFEALDLHLQAHRSGEAAVPAA